MALRQHATRISRQYPLLLAGAYLVWRRFQARFSAGAVGVVFNTEGQILLVEHAFHAKHPWGLPGGWVARREDPAVTVRREIREELSLTVEVGAVLLVETPFPSHLDLAYLCHTTGSIGTLSFELLDYAWCSPQHLPPLSPFHRRAILRALEVTQVIS